MALSAAIHLTAAAVALFFNGSQSASPGQAIQRSFHDKTTRLAVVLRPSPAGESSFPRKSPARQFLSDSHDSFPVPSHELAPAPPSPLSPKSKQNIDANSADGSEPGDGRAANSGQNDVAPSGIVLPAFIQQTPIPLDHSSLSSFDGKASALATIIVTPQGKAQKVDLSYDGDPLPDEFKDILYQSLMQTDYAPALVNGLPSQGTLSVVIDIAPPPKAQLLEKTEIFTSSGGTAPR